MSRWEAFKGLESHPWLGRTYGKLTKVDLVFCEWFINERQQLDDGEFEQAVNRMWLDATSKPKTSSIIMELLSCANTIAKGQK